jgi:hypothetical protein
MDKITRPNSTKCTTSLDSYIGFFSTLGIGSVSFFSGLIGFGSGVGVGSVIY